MTPHKLARNVHVATQCLCVVGTVGTTRGSWHRLPGGDSLSLTSTETSGKVLGSLGLVFLTYKMGIIMKVPTSYIVMEIK